MKRIVSIPVLLLTFCAAEAQEPADALRYSWLQTGGTARAQAIGGALTALGGDLSSTFVNPAGLGMFRTNEFVLSPGFSFDNNKANYLGEQDKAGKSHFDFGASGLILSTPGSRNGNWRNFSFGMGVNRVADFNSKYQLEGQNSQSSYSEKYLEELIRNNVTDPNSAANSFPYGASLAFNTFLIDTLQGPGGVVDGYRSQATPQTGLIQNQEITTKGGISELGFGGSANLKDKLYLGATVGIQFLNYTRNSTFRESDLTGNTSNNFAYFTTEEYLKTEGTGVNVKLGLIFKPVEQWRLGLAFHSPTIYNLEDRYNTRVTTDLEGYAGSGTLTQSSKDFNSGQDGEFAYSFVNPWRLMGGMAYVFREEQDITRQKGFISADIEYVSFRAAEFESDFSSSGSSNEYFNDLNAVIDETYRTALNLRVGGELKFNTLMVRAGFALQGNPYDDKAIDAGRMQFSGGLGYRNKGRFIDLTYVHQITKDEYFPYRLDQGFFAPASINAVSGTILLTVGVKF